MGVERHLRAASTGHRPRHRAPTSDRGASQLIPGQGSGSAEGAAGGRRGRGKSSGRRERVMSARETGERGGGWVGGSGEGPANAARS